MTITQYIEKHGIKTPPHSDVEPVTYPYVLLKDEPMDSTFLGMNEDKTFAVALFERQDRFVVYETKTGRRVTGRISEDCRALS